MTNPRFGLVPLKSRLVSVVGAPLRVEKFEGDLHASAEGRAALQREVGSYLTATGALAVRSGAEAAEVDPVLEGRGAEGVAPAVGVAQLGLVVVLGVLRRCRPLEWGVVVVQARSPPALAREVVLVLC